MNLKYAARSLLATFDIIHLPAIFFGLMTFFIDTPLYGVFRMLSISPAYLLVLLYITHVFLAVVIGLYIINWINIIRHKQSIGKTGVVLDVILIAVLVFELVYMKDWALCLKYF